MTALVILAAGASTRFGRPKQIERVGPSGEALMDYAVFDGLAAGAETVHVVVRPETEDTVRRHFAHLDPLPQLIPQPLPDVPGRTSPWGTGHAILVALRHAGCPCVVLNADDFYGRSALTAAFAHAARLRADEPGGAVAGYPIADTLSDVGGVSRAQLAFDNAHALLTIREHTGVVRDHDTIRGETADGTIHVLPAGTRVSMNLWIVTPALIDVLEPAFAAFQVRAGTDADMEFRFPDVVNEALMTGTAQFEVLAVDEPWCGLTFPGDRAIVVDRLKQLTVAGEYPSPLFPS